MLLFSTEDREYLMTSVHHQRARYLIVVYFVVHLLLLVGCNNQQLQIDSKRNSTLDDVRLNREISIGYAIYPPYIQKDLNTGELTGFSIDVAKELARQMDVKPKFIESTWDTFISDIKLEKFQLFVGPIFHSVKRAMEVDFPEPYGYFSAVAGLAKKSENRFASPSDLDKEGIVISVPQAWTSHEWAKRFLTKPKINAFKQSDASFVFADLVAGNCDVALADAPSVQQYLEKNPNQDVKPLFLDKPVSFVQAGFAITKGDPIWLEFVSESIRIMRTEGTIGSLAQKYNLYSFDEDVSYKKQ